MELLLKKMHWHLILYNVYSLVLSVEILRLKLSEKKDVDNKRLWCIICFKRGLDKGRNTTNLLTHLLKSCSISLAFLSYLYFIIKLCFNVVYTFKPTNESIKFISTCGHFFGSYCSQSWFWFWSNSHIGSCLIQSINTIF